MSKAMSCLGLVSVLLLALATTPGNAQDSGSADYAGPASPPAPASAPAPPVDPVTGLPAVGFFQPKYPFTQADLVYPYITELDNPYVCKTGTNMKGTQPTGEHFSVLSLAPCNYITEHYHPDAYEMNYVMAGGPLTYWIIRGNGSIFSGSTPLQSIQVMPKGLTHTILNDNCHVTTLFHNFNDWKPPLMFTIASVAATPSRFKKSTFVGGTFPNEFPSNKGYIIPDKIHTLDLACMARCGLTDADFEKTGQFGDNLCTPGHLDPLFDKKKY